MDKQEIKTANQPERHVNEPGASVSKTPEKKHDPGRKTPANRSTWMLVAGAFILLCILGWMNEILDIPHILLGAPETPVNWQESIFETVLTALIGFFAVSRVIRNHGGRIRAENALTESEQRLSEIINFLPDGTFAIDLEGKVIAWNRAMEEMTGVNAANIIGKGNYEYGIPFYGTRRPLVIDLVFKPDEELEQKYAFVRKEKDALIAETRIQTPKGKILYLWGKAGPIYDNKGNVVGSIESVRDMTEYRLAEEAVRESEHRYRSLVDTMNDGLIVRDKNGQISFINNRLCQIWGRSQEEIINHYMEEFLDDENRPLFEEQMVKREKGIYEPYEITWTRKDGLKVVTINSPMSIIDSEGNFSGSFSVVTDITKRKEAEEALAQKAVELARSNSELEQFAYVASHDLQEPLRKIQAFGERLNAKCGEAIDDQGRDYLKRMQNAARRMQVLINDLLSFSRVTSRAQPFIPVDLNKVVKEDLLNLELLIEQTNGRVEVGDLPTIDADPTQMRQLMQNLIGNGLKFHREGVAPAVKVHSQIFKGPKKRPYGKVCQIVVEDNGIGFDEKYAERIFGVFQRLHGRGIYEGTGIGLAVCRKIVERHGGHITAKSTPGQGATFTVTLPVKQSKEGTEQ